MKGINIEKRKMYRQELLKKIRELIKKQQLPEEVKKMVDSMYKEYYHVCQEFLLDIKQSVENNEKLIAHLNDIIDYMKKDYEEDRDTTYEMGEISYLIKLNEKVEDIKSIMNMIENDKEPSNEHKELLLGVEVKELTKEDVGNKKCTQTIVASILLEINSSQKALTMKLSNIKGLGDIQQSKEEFLEKINQIINKVKLELAPQITQTLDTQDIVLDKTILDLYDQYKKENEQPSNSKETFVSSLHVEVDPTQAIEKLAKGESTSFIEKEIGG